MPVPLSSAFFAAGAILLPLSETAGAVLACVGLVNQAIVTFSAVGSADDGLG